MLRWRPAALLPKWDFRTRYFLLSACTFVITCNITSSVNLAWMLLPRSLRPDRRRWPRHVFNTRLEVLTKSARLDGRGIKLSQGGMCLFTLSHLDLGSEVRVEFVPSKAGKPVRVSGIVRSRALYLYGIEFRSEEFQPHWMCSSKH